MKEVKLFPEGLEEALANLLKVLATSPHSFSVQVYRYEGAETYTAKVAITNLEPAAASVTVGP